MKATPSILQIAAALLLFNLDKPAIIGPEADHTHGRITPSAVVMYLVVELWIVS